MPVAQLSVLGRQLKKKTLCFLRIMKKYMSQVQEAVGDDCTIGDL